MILKQQQNNIIIIINNNNTKKKRGNKKPRSAQLLLDLRSNQHPASRHQTADKASRLYHFSEHTLTVSHFLPVAVRAL